jgi:D-psicose/D-tagatose/L-ribulose 3-epimerase
MKIALCNEVLQPLPFEQQCAMAAALGYDGLEVAPFTLAEDPTRIDDQEAMRLRTHRRGPRPGHHRPALAAGGARRPVHRERRRCPARAHGGGDGALVDLCAILGGKYLVHGSPKQRSVPPGATREQALDRARECLARAARRAAMCSVTYCLEPLSRKETDLFNTVAKPPSWSTPSARRRCAP